MLNQYCKWVTKILKVSQGQKNSRFLETYIALKFAKPDFTKRAIFRIEGEFLTYRQIQHAYDNAFAKAGLEFTGKHIMRHGDCRRIFNKTGDLALAQQV